MQRHVDDFTLPFHFLVSPLLDLLRTYTLLELRQVIFCIGEVLLGGVELLYELVCWKCELTRRE